jgi:hypothetical protein
MTYFIVLVSKLSGVAWLQNVRWLDCWDWQEHGLHASMQHLWHWLMQAFQCEILLYPALLAT